MFKTVLKFLVSILLIPLAIAVTISFYHQLQNIRWPQAHQTYFFIGVVAYLVLHLVFYKPITVYVFGHELTHAISSWLCGGRVSSFSVSSSRGSVVSDKTNFFIALSPYLIPIYTLIILILYGTASIFYNTDRALSLFIFLLGFSLTFHLVLTIEFLKMHQPDILKTGLLFSVLLIFIVNLAVVMFVLGLVFSGASFRGFAYESFALCKKTYFDVFKQLFL